METKALSALIVCAFACVYAEAGESFYHSAAGGERPMMLSGFVEDDFRKFALTAKVCVGDRMPQPNILQSWKKLGVKMLRRAAWDPEGSAEFFRRQAGFLPFAEGADGVWLEGEKTIPETWKRALVEAKVDLYVAQYLDSLADEALKHKDHHIVLEGRRVKWMFDEFNFQSADLDRLRLEFVAFAKYLEQKLGKSPRNLPVAIPPRIEPDILPFKPCTGMETQKKQVKFGMCGLVGNAFFRAGKEKFEFLIPQDWRRYRLKFYVKGEESGAYVPYEYLVDLSDMDTGLPQAPVVGKGLFTIENRFGGDERRCLQVPRRSWSRRSPCPVNRDLKFNSGWAIHAFPWQDFYGFWPNARKGSHDVWYAIIDRMDGSAPIAFELEWCLGEEVDFNVYAGAINHWRMTERYKQAISRTRDLFSRAEVEARYGCTKTSTPTFQLFDPASDAMFLERCLDPRIAANAKLAKATHAKKLLDVPDYVRGDKEVRSRIWHALDRLLYFEYGIEAVRRDYLALRFAGKEPAPANVKVLVPTEAPVNKNGAETDEKKFWE